MNNQVENMILAPENPLNIQECRLHNLASDVSEDEEENPKKKEILESINLEDNDFEEIGHY